MMTTTSPHTWVKHTITRVNIMDGVKADDPPIVVLFSEDQEEGEEDAQYGCDMCGLPLQGNLHTECEGPPA